MSGNREVIEYDDSGDVITAVVKVVSLPTVPEEILEIRARTEALATTVFSNSTLLADEIKLGKVDRFTEITNKDDSMNDPGQRRVTMVYTVEIDPVAN